MRYDAFISYARKDGKDAARSIRDKLKKAFLDDTIKPGDEWARRIKRAIDDSAVFFFLITPGSIESDYCQKEWNWARDEKKPIIPVMVEDVPEDRVDKQYHPFRETVYSIQYIQPKEARGWQNYHVNVQAVFSEFERAMTLATKAVSFIPLSMEEKPGYTDRKPNPFVRTVHGLNQTTSYSIDEAWEEYDEQVLLLGDPGAGKTTILLHHAQNLIQAYVADPNNKLPFYAPIVRWDPYEDKPLAKWFGETYDIPESITRYIEHGEAILIFDGLDELGSSRPIDPEKPEEGTFDPRKSFMKRVQEAVDASNAVLITCRMKDYEAIGEQLADMGAVELHPLNDGQIRDYLHAFPTVHDTVMNDPDLLDICRSPLLLSLIAFGYRDAPADLQKLGSLKEGALRDAIFGRYIETSYNYEATRRASRDEEMPFTLQKVLEVLGHAAMTNASGGYRAERANRDIFENVLVRYDFANHVDSDQIDVLCELACDLHVLYSQHEDEAYSFLHLRLRDHLAFSYSVKHLQDPTCYSGYVGFPSPAGALKTLGDSQAVEPLIAALANKNVWIRKGAVVALAALRDGIAVEPLIQGLKDSDLRIRSRAAQALGELGDPRAYWPLIEALSDTKSNVQTSAATALAKLVDHQAIEPLINALGHTEDVVAEAFLAAANELGKLDIMGTKPLVFALNSKNSEVRISAINELGKMNDHTTVEPLINTLIQAIEDDNADVILAVTDALKELGKLDDLDPQTLIQALTSTQSI